MSDDLTAHVIPSEPGCCQNLLPEAFIDSVLETVGLVRNRCHRAFHVLQIAIHVRVSMAYYGCYMVFAVSMVAL